MTEKTYRPKANQEGLTVSFPVGGKYATIEAKDWPYTTDDREEQALLDAHDAVTDRPEPKSEKSVKPAERGSDS